VCIGLGQGVQPLLGYCVGAKNWGRFKEAMRFSLVFAFVAASAMTGVCYLLTEQIVRMILTDATAFEYGCLFARILLSTSFLFGVFYVLANALQAAGAATAALIINLSRQGFIYIPALFVLKAAIGANGLAWTQPVADLLSTALVVFLYVRTVKRMEANAGK
jgi:Na+-driven multidrug efflux pump